MVDEVHCGCRHEYKFVGGSAVAGDGCNAVLLADCAVERDWCAKVVGVVGKVGFCAECRTLWKVDYNAFLIVAFRSVVGDDECVGQCGLCPLDVGVALHL